jgi:hypothetical protein
MSDIVHPFTREDERHGDQDTFYFDSLNRERVDTVVEDWLVDGLVPIGAMVVYADPGAGKSMVGQQIIHHLAYGRPLGPWGKPTQGGALVRVFDLESWWKLTQDRSYSITPYGELPGDGHADRRDHYIAYSTTVIPPRDAEEWSVIPSQPERHALYLEQMLQQAQEAGMPLRLVVIDTLTKFVGPKPAKAAGNSYEYEAAVIDRLNRLGLDYRCAIMIIHHTNKAGEISGSQGIGGSATVTCKLKVAERTEDEIEQGCTATGVLVSTKVRIGADFCYAVEQRADGVWEFVDKAPSAAEAAGNARVVLAALADGPKTKAQLASTSGLANSLAKTLTRMRKQGLIHSKYGQWHMVRDERRTLPGEADGRCEICRGPMTITYPGQTAHPGCTPPEDPPTGGGGSPAPVAPVEPDSGIDVSDASEPERKTAFQMLTGSISKSRMKPILRVSGEHRAEEPWSLVTEAMSGEHRWTRHPKLADGVMVTTLDRSGSYPSAMGSVLVAANLLHHTGPMEALPPKTGGLFLVPAVEWAEECIGHPLGRLADQEADTWWVTTPHMQLLEKLHRTERIKRPVILDSWTGRGTSGLFTAFSKEVQAMRSSAQLAGDAERYAEVKRSTSVAIRCMWPKQTQSPIWRPDWNVSVRAEASTRHWIRADQASASGTSILRLGRVDEVDIAGPLVVPAPYVLGTSYGQVKIKAQRTYGEWVADRGNRTR